VTKTSKHNDLDDELTGNVTEADEIYLSVAKCVGATASATWAFIVGSPEIFPSLCISPNPNVATGGCRS
jgi:hypothetical protein